MGWDNLMKGGVTMKKIIIILISLLLVGCAAQTWNHPNLDQDRFKRDVYECQKDARFGAYRYSGLWQIAWEERIFKECMESKGYYKVK